MCSHFYTHITRILGKRKCVSYSCFMIDTYNTVFQKECCILLNLGKNLLPIDISIMFFGKRFLLKVSINNIFSIVY